MRPDHIVTMFLTTPLWLALLVILAILWPLVMKRATRYDRRDHDRARLRFWRDKEATR